MLGQDLLGLLRVGQGGGAVDVGLQAGGAAREQPRRALRHRRLPPRSRAQACSDRVSFVEPFRLYPDCSCALRGALLFDQPQAGIIGRQQ